MTDVPYGDMSDREAMRNRAQGMIRTLNMAMVAALNAGHRAEALDISAEIDKWKAVLDAT